MSISKKPKVLFIGHDHLLEHEDQVETDFVGGLGRGMGQSKEEFRKDSLGKILKVILRVLTRQYDQIILPAALILRSAEQRGAGIKKRLAKAIYRLSYSPRACAVIKKIIGFFLKGKPAAFFGRYSQMTVHRPMFQFFPKAVLFKTIAHRSYPERPDLRVVPTNYWINVDCYPKTELVPFERRGRGVFYSGATVFRQRLRAPEIEKVALARGVDFYWERERMDFETYVKQLENCQVAWSPEGSNWQCWRHYEALYYGAIPLINRPDSKIYHTLVHGETCFLYDTPEEAVDLMEQICLGDLRLSTTEEERREFVVREHSEYALGRILTTELGLR